MAHTSSENTLVTPKVTEADRRIFNLHPVVQAETVARRVWVGLYPHENANMLRWVLA